METRQSIHGEWSSRWAFILAATGAAVGLGNIWKFPYIAGLNGGGAFVLVYLVCIVILGLPIMIAEIVVGRHGRQNPEGSMRSLAIESDRSKHWQWIGSMSVLAGFLILTYYSVIAGWAVDYVFQALLGHFNNVSAKQIQQLFQQLISSPYRLLFWHSVVMISTISVVAFGVEKGIERAVTYLFPTMLALLLVLVGYSMGTGYFAHGLAFLFKPNFSALTANAILIALGHAFFTLSLATGSIMMYGAYLPRDASIPRASMFIAAADTLIALVAGLAIFPIVFANKLTPAAGPGLIFKTLPIAFGKMPYGQVFGVLFFIMLVFAAYTSTISLLEPSVAWLIEKTHVSRKRAAIIVGFCIWALGLATVFSFNIGSHIKLFGLNMFDAIDYLTANIMLPLGGLLISIFAAWRLRKALIVAEFQGINGIFYWCWHYCIGIIGPIAIIIVFLNAIGII